MFRLALRQAFRLALRLELRLFHAAWRTSSMDSATHSMSSRPGQCVPDNARAPHLQHHCF